MTRPYRGVSYFVGEDHDPPVWRPLMTYNSYRGRGES